MRKLALPARQSRCTIDHPRSKVALICMIVGLAAGCSDQPPTDNGIVVVRGDAEPGMSPPVQVGTEQVTEQGQETAELLRNEPASAPVPTINYLAEDY
jgi:hypothetical protein